MQNQIAEPLKLLIACGPIEKRKGHSKINEQIKHSLYAWITRHHQFFLSPISNGYLKFLLDDQT